MKKAITPLLSWILIIGIAVTLGAFVINWAIPFVEKVIDTLDRGTNPDLYCSNTVIEIEKICFRDPNTNKSMNITIKNKGNYNITRLTINRENTNESIQSCYILNPGDGYKSFGDPSPGKIVTFYLATAGDLVGQPFSVIKECVPEIDDLDESVLISLIEAIPWVKIEGKDVVCSGSKITINNINVLNTNC